jgi:sphingomyelin phosphodiesterase
MRLEAQLFITMVPDLYHRPTPHLRPQRRSHHSGMCSNFKEKTFVRLSLISFSVEEIMDEMFVQIEAIMTGGGWMTDCSKCISIAGVLHLAAVTQPVDAVTNLLVRACDTFSVIKDAVSSDFGDTCYEELAGIAGLGPYMVQLFSKMSMSTGDMQAYCYYKWDQCTAPTPVAINETQFFKPKPANRTIAPPSSGNNSFPSENQISQVTE